MEQHPIPQQISSYQFRLVGDMTLKQFFQLAGGALFSLLFYASPLHPLIKWPFIIFFALLGVALAFLPFEERPLDRWIVAFFRSVYSPTLYFWQKGAYQTNFFQEEAAAPQEKVIAPQGESALNAYLSAPPQRSPFFAKLEDAEQGFLSKMSQLFGPGTPTPGGTNIQTPTIQGLPQQAAPSMKPISESGVNVEEKPSEQTIVPQVQLSQVSQTIEATGSLSGKGAVFSLEAAPPSPPTVPNTIVGQVIDTNGKIIEGAILEIKDAAGRPVRALKSNKLGHFIIVTPLQSGRYEMIIDKEGFVFEPITFDALGDIIPPMSIQGKIEPKVVTVEEPGVNPVSLTR